MDGVQRQDWLDEGKTQRIFPGEPGCQDAVGHKMLAESTALALVNERQGIRLTGS